MPRALFLLFFSSLLVFLVYFVPWVVISAAFPLGGSILLRIRWLALTAAVLIDTAGLALYAADNDSPQGFTSLFNG